MLKKQHKQANKICIFMHAIFGEQNIFVFPSIYLYAPGMFYLLFADSNSTGDRL